MDDPELIPLLIQLGRSSDKNLINALQHTISPMRPIDYLHSNQEEWRSLSIEDLVSEIKGFIMWGQSSRRGTGGSVSPVQAMYRHYVDIDPTGEKSLADWIHRHRTNEYDPFGASIYRTARSFADCRKIDTQRRNFAALKAKQHQEEMNIEQTIAYEKQLRQSAETLPKAIKCGDFKAVSAIIDNGAAPCKIAGYSSYHQYALEYGSTKIAELLRSRGL